MQFDDKTKYRELLYQRFNDYVQDVESGSIIACKDIQAAVLRYKIDLKNPQYFINYKEINKLFNFLFYLRIESLKNQYIQYIPESWQVFYLVNIYGFYWRNQPDKRRFIRSFLTISRKNGKTTLAVIQSLWHLMKENRDAKVYVVSESKNMSTESSLALAKQIVTNSPALFKRVEQMQYSLRYVDGKSCSTFKMLPFKPSALNSLKPSFAIVDELHLMPTSEIVDKLASGMGSTTNPLLSIIGTRGNNSTYYQYQLEQTYKKVLANEVQDETTFIMMFGQDAEIEVQQPETWVKSNPSIGTTLKLDYLQDQLNKAKLTPTSLKEFFSFNLNMWIESKETQYIEQEFINTAFQKGADTGLNLEFFYGREVFLGLDISKIDDLSSLVVLYYDRETKQFYTYPFIYFANNPVKKIRNRGLDLTQWLLDGSIKQSGEKRIDYTEILDDIMHINSKCKIVCLGHDGYNKSEIIPILEKNKIKVEYVSQAIKDITTATKQLDTIFAREQISCINDAYKWQYKNVVPRWDINLNVKCDKKKSLDSIDSVAATVNALELWRQKYEKDYRKVEYKPINISF